MTTMSVHGSAARAAGRSRAMRLNWLHGLASLGWGMVYPYTAIYLARQDEVGTAGAGSYFAAAGIANVAVALILAAGWWRPTRTVLGIVGNCLSIVGYLSIPLAGSLVSVVGAGVLVGLGQGAFMAAIVPTISALIDPADRREVFARRYAILNGTLAAGALITGLLTTVIPAEQLLGWLFVATAVSYIPLGAAQYAVRHHAAGADSVGQSPGNDDRDASRTERSWSTSALLRACAGLMVLQFAAYAIGFSQFESTTPLTIDRLLGLPLVWISVMLGINTAAIIVLQSPITKRLGRYSSRTGRLTAFGIWAFAYVIVAAGSLGSATTAIICLVVFAVVFSAGECAYSCTFHPWLAETVPDRELTRATALTNSTMGAGLFAGPLTGVGLIGLGSAGAVWLVLGIAAAGSAMAVTILNAERTTGRGSR